MQNLASLTYDIAATLAERLRVVYEAGDADRSVSLGASGVSTSCYVEINDYDADTELVIRISDHGPAAHNRCGDIEVSTDSSKNPDAAVFVDVRDISDAGTYIGSELAGETVEQVVERIIESVAARMPA